MTNTDMLFWSNFHHPGPNLSPAFGTLVGTRCCQVRYYESSQNAVWLASKHRATQVAELGKLKACIGHLRRWRRFHWGLVGKYVVREVVQLMVQLKVLRDYVLPEELILNVQAFDLVCHMLLHQLSDLQQLHSAY